MRKVFTLIPSLILLSLSSSGYAAEIDEEENVLEFELDAIVVEENFNRQVDDVELELHSGFVNVIEREEFKSDIQTVADIISKETGLQIRQSGGMGSFALASLRGSSSEQVIVYLDGIPLNSAGSAGFDLSDIEISDVEAIEVYRGATPLHFSQASIGGAINIKRLRHQDNGRHSVTAGAGSFGAKKLAVFTDDHIGNLGYIASLAHSEAENDFQFLNNKGTLFSSSDDEWQRRNNAQFNQQSALLKLSYDLNSNSQLYLNHQYQHKNQHLPAWNNSPDARTHISKTNHHSQLAWTTENLTRYRIDSLVRLTLRKNQEDYDDRQGLLGRNNEYIRNLSNAQTFDYLAELPLANHLFLLNLQITKEEAYSVGLISNHKGSTSTRTTQLLGLQDNWQINDNFSLVPAIRLYALKDKIFLEQNPLIESSITQEITHHYFSPQLGSKLWLNHYTVIKANWGHYFREPKFSELFGNQGFFISNPELKPETGNNIDIGIIWTPDLALELIDSTRLSIAVFQSNVRDIIIKKFQGGVGRSDNIERAQLTGLETQLDITTSKGLSINAGISLLDTVNQSPSDIISYKKQLPGRYTIKSNIKLQQQWKNMNIYIHHLYEDGGYYDSPNILITPLKKITDIGVSITNKRSTISLDIQNIFSHRHEDFYRYPMPGISWFTSFKYKY